MKTEVLADGVVLYCGDCREAFPQIQAVDAVVTDPPYGIDYGGMIKNKGGENGGLDANRWKAYDRVTWDENRPPKEVFDAILKISRHQIIWGGNYFTDFLPPTMQWLIWDKCQRDFSLADFEMAWSSQKAAARIIDYPRPKALLDGRVHPTQKPIEVMRWCIERLPAGVKTILDPFMGSGTTGVAAVKMGRQFIGIEREPAYFEIACRRITEAMRQTDLFVAPIEAAPAPRQDDLL